MQPTRFYGGSSSGSVPEDGLSADNAWSEKPAIAPIFALHRHDDGYIAFAVAREAGEDFRPLVSIRRDELARYFPEFREQLLKDSYVSINAGWRLRRYGKDGAAYGYPLHRTERLRYLCAAYADLDYYRLGVDFGQALGRIVTMQETGYLPKASMIVKSGRRMWLLYLLHDQRDPSRAPGAFPDKLEQYFAVQRAIIERLIPVGADSSARDAARHIRVPGSLHSGAEERVTWWIQGEGPQAYSYSLSQLCGLFGVSIAVRHPKEQAAVEAGTRSDLARAGKRGWAALNARRLREFNVLRSMRGRFYLGTRNNAATLYGWLLKRNGLSRTEVAHQVSLLGSECHPPLAPSECRGAVKTAFSPLWRRISDQNIADRLDILPEESALLERLPEAMKYRSKELPPPPLRPCEVRAMTIIERRAKITQIVADLGHVPTVRAMGERLIEAGFQGNHQTVFKDFKALGLQWERTRAARAERKRKQLVLSDI